MGSSALLLALSTSAPDLAAMSTASAARMVALAPAFDPVLTAATLRAPDADDPLLARVAIRRPVVIIDGPKPREAVAALPPPATPDSPRLDPAFRDGTPRAFARLTLPTLDDTLPQPARRAGGGRWAGRLVLRLAPDGGSIGMAGGVAGALWKLIPQLD